MDDALPPTTPVRPRPMATLAFGTAAGVFLGLLLAVGREVSDGVMRSRRDVQRLTSVPVLAAIPRLPRARRLGGQSAAAPVPRLAARDAPRSPAAEAYRSLRTSISYLQGTDARALRTLVVTSAEPQAGKSTTAANLAVTLAEQGHRVLLVEADQRRPVLHDIFSVSRTPGLADVLGGRATFPAAVHRIPLPAPCAGSLDFLAASADVPNPAELLGSPAFRALLAQVGVGYDTILLDTPPLGLVTDAAVAGAAADGVLLVARLGATHAEALHRALEDLQTLRAPLVGLVLTDVRPDADPYGGYYGRYYGETATEA